ncbi:MAG: type I-C CRISPR-associated protein Cas8c/Csd1 [Dehalococcoidia bacterium]
MLDVLVKYAQEHSKSEIEPGFSPKDIRWAIVCDEGGRFLDVIELGDTNQKNNPGQTFLKCPEMDRGALQGGGKCHFLVETAEVVALHFSKKTLDEPKTKVKLDIKHTYFLQLLNESKETMPELAHLAEKLANPDTVEAIRSRLEAVKAKPTDKVTFKVGNIFPVDSETWHDWWRAFRAKQGDIKTQKTAGKSSRSKGQSKLAMRCFVTGELVEPVATALKIEGLSGVGGLPAGDALICFDKEAFRSYGLEQSTNASVSEQSTASYRAALNDLIKTNGQRLAGAKVVHWFKGKDVLEEEDPMSWLVEGAGQQEMNAQHQAGKLLQSIRAGSRPDLENNYFYALTLSGAAGRVMVRDWMEGQFEELVGNVHKWFNDLDIVRRDGGHTAPSPKFFAVLSATVRDPADLPAPFVTKMWRVAIRGEPIPQTALARAVERARVAVMKDEVFNHARMGLIKAYHLRKGMKGGNQNMGTDLKPYLNEEHPHPAYHCGRLMAVMADLQYAALGNVGAGVVQRYYAAASSTPALVLGRLTRTSQFHLNKLDPGLAYWYESKIANIWGHIKDGIPGTLSLEEQSLFALGYYQQIADRRAKQTDKVKNQPQQEDNNE